MSTLVVLWNRPFLTIAVSNLASRMGTVIFDVVLAWWLVERTGSAVASGYVLAASTLPIAVLGPVSGALADRWSKKAVLVGTDLVSAIAAAVVAVMVYLDRLNLPVLVAASLALGVCTSLFKPAMRSAVPALVPEKELVRANSLTSNFAETTKVIGPALGAILIPLLGAAGALLVNAASFALSAAAQATVQIAARQIQRKENLLESLRSGFRYMAQHRLIRNLLVMCGLVNFFLVSFNVLLPLYVNHVLGQGSGVYSSVLIAEAVGGIAITALLLAKRAIEPKPGPLVWLIVASGLSLALMPLASGLPVLLLLAGLQGAFMAAFNTFYFAYIQKVTDAEYLGRVFSIVYMVAVGAMPLSFVLFGHLGDHILGAAFVYAGLGTVAASLPFLRIAR